LSFIKDVTIYEKGKGRVYINQCHNKGRKTKCFAVRREDNSRLGEIIGEIKWNSKWRQYCFFPEKETTWSKGCLIKIVEFLDAVNLYHAGQLFRRKFKC